MDFDMNQNVRIPYVSAGRKNQGPLITKNRLPMEPRHSRNIVQSIMFSVAAVFIGIFISSCANESASPSTLPSAEEIVDRVIDNYGTDKLENARMTFNFRDREYVISRNSGVFSYERIFTDSTGAQVREILSNNGFSRFVDGESWTPTTDAEVDIMAAWERSVNAVIYFTRLPAPLNDGAVIKRFIEQTTIEGEPFYEIEVTFRQEGGGRDFQDRFIYWFHAENFTMDYMAYYFYTDEEGSRFRKAINRRKINGVTVQDYLNYSGENISFETVETYDTLFDNGDLTLVSEIINENIMIEPLIAN